jgi:hypothetical protein
VLGFLQQLGVIPKPDAAQPVVDVAKTGR